MEKSELGTKSSELGTPLGPLIIFESAAGRQREFFGDGTHPNSSPREREVFAACQTGEERDVVGEKVWVLSESREEERRVEKKRVEKKREGERRVEKKREEVKV